MKWIRIKDRTPEEGQNIVALFEHKGYIDGKLQETDLTPCIGKYYPNGDWMSDNTMEADGVKVTSKVVAWLPIPDYSQFYTSEQ